MAGVVFFGFRVLMVAMLSVAACSFFEWAYFRVTRTPALLGRSHACLTGLLLALTLPPFVPWYVPVVGAAFAIIVGKAVFGGIGHFWWQPALVGRLAVAAVFGAMLNPALWPLLASSRAVTGDITACSPAVAHRGWAEPVVLAEGVDGPMLPRPTGILQDLGFSGEPVYERITDAIMELPRMSDSLLGATGGGIGETASLVLVLMGLYLVYRHYVTWLLPLSFILAAAVAAALLPVRLLGADDLARTVWLPLTAEGVDVGVTYVAYHLASGGLLLAAFFLAPEMTTRPITPLGQVLFGLGCGAAAIALRLYTRIAIPCYAAVLIMNTFVPLLDRFTRPRVLGTRPWWMRAMRRG